ncbi:MAG: hypothetical protein QXN23_01130 [Candidatus Caldarchaeum sp.]|nr:hypothetical protein [Candidatus Caldarchaeales archaeon]MDJ0273267.1 hypothetical protein [Candidatus Caldarchaeales archaeon]
MREKVKHLADSLHFRMRRIVFGILLIAADLVFLSSIVYFAIV